MNMIASTQSGNTEWACSVTAWLGNLRHCVGAPWAEILLVATALVCGMIIGHERKSRKKPVGRRTLTLICTGSTIFTFCSILLATGPGDATRIASNIVTGIGFLGAGTIMRDRGTVTGMTTAATIWIVAGIGMLIGAGYAVAGLALSLVVVALLELGDPSRLRHELDDRDQA